MLQTNLIGRKAKSKLSGDQFEIVAVAWEESAGGRLSRYNHHAITMLDNDE